MSDNGRFEISGMPCRFTCPLCGTVTPPHGSHACMLVDGKWKPTKDDVILSVTISLGGSGMSVADFAKESLRRFGFLVIS